MTSSSQPIECLVGIFTRRKQAEAAVRDLVAVGFTDQQLGFAGPGALEVRPPVAKSEAQPGSTTAGGVVGGVLGAVVAGLVPGIGPLVTGGVLAGLGAPVPAQAALGGIAGILRCAGITGERAGRYAELVGRGRYLVTIQGERLDGVSGILAARSGLVEGEISRAVTAATGTSPADEPVEGIFASWEIAEAVAERLRAAFPEGEVTIEDERPRLALLGSAVERRRRVRLRVVRRHPGGGGPAAG